MSDELEATEDIGVTLPDSYGSDDVAIPDVVTHMNSIIGSAFRAANDKRARSHQKALGMSELGGCRRQAGFKVNGTPESNPANERMDIYADAREAMIGSLIHDLILPQIAAMSMTAEIEVPVVLKFTDLPAVPGHADMVDEDVLVDLKGLALDTEIPTPTGWTTMAMLQPGDQVLDRWGKPCTVTAVTDVRNIGCYRVTFKGVGSIVCDEEHIWPARYGSGNSKTNSVADRSITELEKAWLDGKTVAVPVAEPLDLPDVDLPLDPYLVGYWLGNGTKGAPELTCGVDDAEEVADFVRAAGWGATVRWLPAKDGDGLRGARILMQSERGVLRALMQDAGLLGTKVLPQAYLRGSINQRLALLQGLMDSDGSWNKARNRAQFGSTDPALTDIVRELITSLGLRAQTQSVLRTGFGKTVMSYDVEFTPSADWNPFRLKRKATRVVVPGIKNRNWHSVWNIERIESVPTKCIAVDSADHTFLAGRAMVPTHNCVTPETPILMADGRVLRADEVKADDRVVAYDQVHDLLQISYISEVRENGDQPTVEITTASGRALEVTEEHPIWIKRSPDALGEWVRADEVELGMAATVALTAPEEDQTVERELGDDEPWLLGLLAAIQFRPEDIENLSIDPVAQTVALDSIALMGQHAVDEMWGRNPWIELRTPVIPDEVVLAGARAWTEWLAGFSAVAMTLDDNGVQWAVVDRQMAEQMAAMLAGIGIKVTIDRGIGSDYTLHLRNDDYGLRRLANALWLRGSKGLQLNEMASELDAERPDYYDLDPIVQILQRAEPTRTLAISIAEYKTFVTAGLISHNTVGTNSARYYQTHGASKKHLWQTHGYGQALINNGHEIKHVALVYVDRSNGQVVHIHYQPFDKGIVDDIEMWWTEVNAAKDPMDLPRDERGPGLSRTCDWCPWLNACWGPDAKPGVSGSQKVIIHEASDATREVESHLIDYAAAAAAEKEAIEAKKFHRSVLTEVESGRYGSYVLAWGKDSSFEVLDAEAAEAALTAAGLPIPKIERIRQGAIRIKRA